MSNDLARQVDTSASIEVTPRELEARIAELVAGVRKDELNEVRQRAEAQALYEKRKGNAERERYFAKLRILAEAGIGALSFDDSSIIPSSPLRTKWRALGAAFERGKLLDICDAMGERSLAADNVAIVVRQKGLTYAPGRSVGSRGSLRWFEARLIAREKGIPLSSIPADAARASAISERSRKTSERMQRTYAAAERLERMRNQKVVAAAARARGGKIEEAYASLRKTLQALHDAQDEFTVIERRSVDFDYLFHRLYDVEDSLGKVLKRDLLSIRMRDEAA